MSVSDNATPEAPKEGVSSAGELKESYLEALKLLKDSYYLPEKSKPLNAKTHDGDHLTSSDARDKLISDVAASFNDPWTEFRSNKSMEKHQRKFSGGDQRSAGIWVKSDNHGEPHVSAVLHGFAGFDSKLRAGDTLLSINDQPLNGKKADDIEEMLGGRLGENLKVKYHTPDNTVDTANITLADPKPEKASAQVITGNHGEKILYATLPRFDKDAIVDFDDAVDAVLKTNPDKSMPMVLNLRGNEGGLVGSAQYFESEFLKDGIAFKQIFREGDKRVTTDQPVMPLTFFTAKNDLDRLSYLRSAPLVVMIDDSSRSAAETVTAGLRDRNRLDAIVGTKSFGKGIAYEDFPISAGTLRISTSMVESPKGEIWHGKGLKPNIWAERPRNSSEDLQLAASIKELERRHNL